MSKELTDIELLDVYFASREDTLDSFVARMKQVLNGYTVAPYYPVIGSKWKHHKGEVYIVLGVTSSPEEFNAEKFPISVFYEGPDGRRWTRTLESWKQSFTPL